MIIAQISDIHAREGSASLDVMNRLSYWLNALHPDALIISGDIADAPHAENYARVADILNDFSFPIYMIPGNKDDRDEMRAAFLRHNAYWPATGPMHFDVTVKDMRIIGFDVTVPDEKWGDAEPGLPWLTSTLEADRKTPTLIMMHQHPFLSGIANLDENMCRNGEKLRHVLVQARNVVGLTCGHGHRAIMTRFSTQAMMCPSITGANPLKLGPRGEPTAIDVPGLLVHSLNEAGYAGHFVSVG
jgi:Icc protein